MIMNIEKLSNSIENALASLGLNPTESRCEEEGQWLIFNGETEIYIDIWEQKEESPWIYFQADEPVFIFQIISPVCFVKEMENNSFYEEILHNNLNMLNASYIFNKEEGVLAVKIRNNVKAITPEQVIDAIENVGYYSEITFDILKERYPVERIAKEN